MPLKTSRFRPAVSTTLLPFFGLQLLLLSTALFGAPGSANLELPDFTKGDPLPEGATHDWNLGATGARGWIYSDKMVTTDARQVRIMAVEEGSPADGVLREGDVLLGVAGKLFQYDPRTDLVRP